VPYPDLARCVSGTRLSGGKRAAGFEGGIRMSVYLFFFTFQRLEFLPPFLCSCSQSNFSSCSFKIYLNKNSVKCLQGISFSQLTVAEKAKIKNLGRATSDLGISQSSASGVRT
jgi:hypothetical protein